MPNQWILYNYITFKLLNQSPSNVSIDISHRRGSHLRLSACKITIHIFCVFLTARRCLCAARRRHALSADDWNYTPAVQTIRIIKMMQWSFEKNWEDEFLRNLPINECRFDYYNKKAVLHAVRKRDKMCNKSKLKLCWFFNYAVQEKIKTESIIHKSKCSPVKHNILIRRRNGSFKNG